MQHRSTIVKKELLQISAFFIIVMSVYIIRAAFDLLLILKIEQGWSVFVKKLLQDVFYMIWDLPIVLPPLLMHYNNYKPQFAMAKPVVSPE